ncbi:MAG TPA: nucleoside-diphosphate sugar epimerase [Gammaproteobacteria bacterium]|nr:nucleoside-diphosphate sugar epimerase [Gammaproteobacteria bacterium]
MDDAEQDVGAVWVLADDRTGNVNQAVGVAEALGAPFAIKPLAYDRCGGWPNLVRGASLLGVAGDSRAALAPPWPRVVIAAGRRTVPVARYIKKQSGARTFLVQIMWPGPPLGDLDLVAVPEHDEVPAQVNVMRTLGAPHRVTRARISAEGEKWRDCFADLPRPRIAMLVGGAARDKGFDASVAGDLGRRASELARSAGGSLLITTSRRTGVVARNALLGAIDAPAYLHIWSREGDNPYFAFLGLCDGVIVTGDSTSMCSEACATGRPVYIFAPPAKTAPKHQRLHQALYAGGYARPLRGAFEDWTCPPLNAAEEIAARVRAMVLP